MEMDKKRDLKAYGKERDGYPNNGQPQGYGQFGQNDHFYEGNIHQPQIDVHPYHNDK